MYHILPTDFINRVRENRISFLERRKRKEVEKGGCAIVIAIMKNQT